MTIIKFSQDSKILSCGDTGGHIHSYDITHNFKLIFKDRMYKKEIKDMISIDDE